MTGGTRLSAKIVRFDELSAAELALWRDWRNADAALGSPFLAPDYIRAVGDVHPGARVAVLARGGRVGAFLPFQYPSGLARALGHGEPAGGRMTDAVGAIAAPGFEANPQELLRATGLTSFLFTHLVSGQQRCGLTAMRLDHGLVIDLAAEPDYWGELRRRRHGVVDEISRRRRRVSEKLGPIDFRLETAAPLETLEWLIAMKTAQYRRTGAGNALKPARTRNLLRHLASVRAPDCMGVTSTLEAGGRRLAAHFGLRSGAVLHYWFPVYDPEFAKYAPGRLLLAAIIDAAPAHGIVRIDRGVGTASAKRDFANAKVVYGRGLMLDPGLRSGIVRLALSARWRWQRLSLGSEVAPAQRRSRPMGAAKEG